MRFLRSTLLVAGACALAACPSQNIADGGSCACGPVDSGPPPVCGADAGSDGGAFASGWPQVPSNVGRVMNPMTLVTLVASNDGDSAELAAFSDDVAASGWLTTVGAEYGVGPIAQSAHYSGPPITSAMSSGQIRAYIGSAITSAAVPAPNGNTLYLLYIPALDGGGFSDSTFCGYHDTWPSYTTTSGDGFAAVQRCSANATLDSLTTTASHEIAEAATDPGLRSYTLGFASGMPWTQSKWLAVQNDYIEVGDLCEGTFSRDDAGYGYQRIWSNAAARAGGDPCVPATGTYFNLQFQQDWYSAAAGSVASIPFTAWSTGSVSNWNLNPHIANAQGGFQRAVLQSSLVLGTNSSLGTATCTGTGGSYTYAQMNVGANGTLQVHVPTDAQPGDWILLDLHSFDLGGTDCIESAGTDSYRTAFVGVYVPLP